MPTLEEAIGIFEQLSKLCETNGIHDSQELYKQYAEWLRELQERRKAPEIIHCSECVYSNKEYSGEIWCGICNGFGISEDSFCSFAERRPDADT